MADIKQDLVAVDMVGERVDSLCDILKIETKAGRTFVRVALANSLLMDRKQKDYGPHNMSAFGMFGAMVRMNDKMERLKHLYNTKGRKMKSVNESIQDSFRDISNYALIALMIDLEMWPNV